MADYSIDDILAELDAKKGVKSTPQKSSVSIDDILGNDNDLSATAILADLSHTERHTEDTTENETSEADADTVSDGHAEQTAISDTKDGKDEADDEPVKPEKATKVRGLFSKLGKKEKPADNTEEASDGGFDAKNTDEASEEEQERARKIAYHMERAREERNFGLNEITGTITDVDKVLHETDIFEKPVDKTDLFVKKEEEPEEKAIPVPEAPIITEEEIREREKRAEENRRLMLSKERENSDPDDMLDLVNPLEVKEKVKEQVKEQDLAPVSEFSDMYAGNTQGIANGDLKAIDVKDKSNADASSETKEIKGNNDDTLVTDKKPSPSEQLRETDDVKPYPAKSSTNTLIERLNKSLAQQRQENVKAHRTITLTNVHGKKPIIAPLNIDYKNQVIVATGTLQQENPVVELEKQQELQAQKKHKLKDFVLEDDGVDDIPDENEEEAEEFDDYDSTGQIWADLNASHKGLKVRLGLLLVVTLISVFASLMNDFDLFNAWNMGDALSFMNVRGDVTTLMYIYLVCGILGFVICASAVSNGLIKLFTGKADCDSVCAATSALSIIGAVAALIDGQSFKLGHSCIYVSTALVALCFNTIGKIYMISRAKRNFKFVSGDSQKYYTQIIKNDASASVLTKVAVDRIPIIAVMRKTEFLTDFLKSSYCDDDADRLSAKLCPAALIAGVIAGILAFINPFGSEFAIVVDGESPLNWAISAAVAVASIASPMSILFMINAPLERASRKLSECNSAILGYDSAVEFADVNTVLVDAKALFPAGTVQVAKVKQWHKKNPMVKVSVEEAILLAASLAIHTDGVLSYSFYDMTLGDKELLQKVDNCIYEDNCGITGWIGARRVMMGGRQLMKTHHIDLPALKSEAKYCTDGMEPVYLAVSGEIVAMFVISMTPNKEVQNYLKRFEEEQVSVLVRTTDSIVTQESICDIYGISSEYVRVLPHEAHQEYNECTKYTSRGNGALCGSGTFTSFARGVLAAKNLIRDFVLSKSLIIGSAGLGGFLALIMVLMKQISFITPTVVTIYGLLVTAAMLVLQKLRKY